MKNYAGEVLILIFQKNIYDFLVKRLFKATLLNIKRKGAKSQAIFSLLENIHSGKKISCSYLVLNHSRKTWNWLQQRRTFFHSEKIFSSLEKWQKQELYNLWLKIFFSYSYFLLSLLFCLFSANLILLTWALSFLLLFNIFWLYIAFIRVH